MEKCHICDHELMIKKNPLTNIDDAFYCKDCDVYWLKDKENTLKPYCFITIPQLLTEVAVPDAPEYKKLRLSIDTNETKHKNTPHFHIYYGNERSIGYDIRNLSTLGNEENEAIIQQSRNVQKFLKRIKEWMFKPNSKNQSISNQHYMIQRYNQIVGVV